MVNNSSGAAPIASLGDTATDEWGEDVHGGADMGDSDVDAESEEILICDAGAGSDADAFDQIIGRLDELLMDDGFHEIADGFVAKHCGVFDDGEENKLEYTTLFADYTALLERYIESRLADGDESGGFDMRAFCAELQTRSAQLPEELLETLGAYGDFEAFKALMLAAKRGAALEGGPLSVEGGPIHLSEEEMEDGMAIPDLNLTISAC